MQFWFVLVLIHILLFHSCLVALNVLLCSLVTPMKSRYETETWDCNLTVFTAAPLSIIHHFNYYPFKTEAWKGTAAVVTTAKRQKRLPPIPGKEQCTGLSSPCRRRKHSIPHPSTRWTYDRPTWSKPQKSILFFNAFLFLWDLLYCVSVYAIRDLWTWIELLPAQVLLFSERLKDSGKSTHTLAL